jgi:hypothetical protein
MVVTSKTGDQNNVLRSRYEITITFLTISLGAVTK